MSPFLLLMCWENWNLYCKNGQNRDSVFSSTLGFMISFQAFHAISAPRHNFPLIKNASPQTTVQHDKSLRSSHFSTKTIQQSVDSALPPLPMFVAAAACFWSILLTVGDKVQKRGCKHYITTVRAHDQSAWVTQGCCRQGFTSRFHSCGNDHHPAGNGVSWNGGGHYLSMTSFGSD